MVTNFVTIFQMRDDHAQSKSAIIDRRLKEMQCRQEQRHALNASCRVRTGPGLPKRAIVTDLSSEGCAIQSTRLSLRRADRVEVSIGDEHTVLGEVRWSRWGQVVGLRFLRPLDPIDIEIIARKAHRASVEGLSPRQQIVLEQSKLRSVC